MELHAHNRAKLVHNFRQFLKASSRPVYGFIFLQGAENLTEQNADHAARFRQESYFAYLFGVKEAGFYGGIDVSTGKSVLFAPRFTERHAIWSGKIKPLSSYKENYMVSLVSYTDEIEEVLKSHYQGPGKPLLYLLNELSDYSNKLLKPVSLEGIEAFAVDALSLRPILDELRVFKLDQEVEFIKDANDISSAAHIEVMQKTKAGMKEYQLEMIFMYHICIHGGCRHRAYTCICASGENSAIIHYGQDADSKERKLEDGDMALMDMGAEYEFYASQISCSYPVNGIFNDNQRLIYNVVLKAHNEVISAIKPGVSWIDMHKLAERTILEGLTLGGILVGDVDSMMNERLGAIFMPHGLGHFLGIDAHDPGGYPQGTERPTELGLKELRTTRELKESMVLTVSPGCYFNGVLLTEAMDNPVMSAFINRDLIESFNQFGGVRIGSVVHVTAKGCENLTNMPRETWEIEAVMSGSSWPLDDEIIKKFKTALPSPTSSGEEDAKTTTEENGQPTPEVTMAELD